MRIIHCHLFLILLINVVLISACTDSKTVEEIECVNWDASNPESPILAKLEPAFNGRIFNKPIDMTVRDGFFFIATQAGQIVVTNAEGKESKELLDLSSYVGPDSGTHASQQWGITSIALSDDFYPYPKLFVVLNDGLLAGEPSRTSKVLAFNFSNPDFTTTIDAINIDSTSVSIIWDINQSSNYHHFGQIKYEGEGNLILSSGDGNSLGAAADNTSTNGKLLRFHMSDNNQISVPEDNPSFDGTKSYVYVAGLRNPWRFSIDLQTSDIWVGDVGASSREEINKVQAGEHYGWPYFEGSECFNQNEQCVDSNFTLPYFEYSHEEGLAVIGGLVYRGNRIPSLYGTYIYNDASNTDINFLIEDEAGEVISDTLISNTGNRYMVGYAEDEDKEVYIMRWDSNTPIYTLVSTGMSTKTDTDFIIPTKLSQTNCVNFSNTSKSPDNKINYSVNAKLWSDDVVKHRSFFLPEASKVNINEDGKFEFPNGSILVKSFERNNKVIETRLLVKHLSGHWGGYSYEWNEEGSDAFLLEEGKTITTAEGVWTFPSKKQCSACHTDIFNATLGIEMRQLSPNKLDFENKAKLDGYIDGGVPNWEAHLYGLNDNVDPELKARSYLHTNCSGCHHPGTTTPSTINFHFDTPFNEMNVCNYQDDTISDSDAKVILKPREKELSSLYQRINRTGIHQMPPLGRHTIDTDAVSIIGSWIDSIETCE